MLALSALATASTRLFNSILVAARSNSLPVFLHELVRMPAEDELAVDFFLRGGGGGGGGDATVRGRR